MGIVTSALDKRWPGSEVRYKIGACSPATAKTIQDAINIITANTTFQFTLRNREKDYIEFRQKNEVDPLSDPPVVVGAWESIRAGHELINLGGNRILDWEPGSGHYRIWNYDPTVTGNADPFPGAPVVEGTWKSIRSGHWLINLGGNRILDWESGSGHYRIWNYDPSIAGNADPFPGAPVVEGTWSSIRSGHWLINLGGNRILDWEPGSGHYRIWNYDPSIAGNADPFPGAPVVEGTWSSIRSGHRLINLGGNRILDWEPRFGHYRIWNYDPAITGNADPFPNPAVCEGEWKTIVSGHTLLDLSNDRVLDWVPSSGKYRIWHYDRDISSFVSNSPIGMEGGRQVVSIAPYVRPIDVVHEIFHSLGFFHEHQRPDRGSKVKINKGNVLNQGGHSEWHNFEKKDTDDVITIGIYDYDSIMHYGRMQFSANGLPTIEAPPPYTTTIGSATNLSSGDIIAAKYIADPLPGPAVCEGAWKSIRSGHCLINLGGNRILDWEPGSGHYRIWNYDPTITGDADPFPGAPVVEGTWKSIRSGHWLINLGGNRILDWESGSGHYRIWNYDPSIAGNADPFPGAPVVEGTWNSIRSGHWLINLGGSRILDWEHAFGHYRIWNYDPSVVGNSDPLPGPPVCEGTWKSIRTGHHLINLSSNRVLDWEQTSGHYRIWNYDPTVSGNADPLPGQPVAAGAWCTIKTNKILISMDGDRVLDWEQATGKYRIWRYAR